jgi:soluble lytic murein transglycosylase
VLGFGSNKGVRSASAWALSWVLTAGLSLFLSAPTQAQVSTVSIRGDSDFLDARDAFRRKDAYRLAQMKVVLQNQRHPLSVWVEYWDLSLHLKSLSQVDLNAFYKRWPNTYLEDRLRNDWLLELGQRRDWNNFKTEYPRFKLNDDREVTCYSLLTRHLDGQDVRQEALASWMAQREADDGCALMAATLYDARAISTDQVWRKARWAMDIGRGRAARQAVALISTAWASRVNEVIESPARFTARRISPANRMEAELIALALTRLAATDFEATARQLSEYWSGALPPDLAAWGWAVVGKQAALKQAPQAVDYFTKADQNATRRWERLTAAQGASQSAANAAGALDAKQLDASDDLLAWKVRAALRASASTPNAAAAWQQVSKTIDAMSLTEQRDAAWVYWKARALLARMGAAPAVSKEDPALDPVRSTAHELLRSISGQLSFYGKLALEELGEKITLPPRPAALTEDERKAALQNPGLLRAMHLIGLSARSEGVKEWNFTLRGMNDRELLAAAQFACERQLWDRCINTSERTRSEVHAEQRFPMPFRTQLEARARQIGLDAAYVYGLIRQESRFISDARSGVGASGLMQLMPATARWTARKIGMVDFSADQVNDREVNLNLGMSYLKLVLDDFEGSQAMAAAAYNAGPNRPRRWREGAQLDAAVWVENIPLTETRDYVKKVLSNATYYAALMSPKWAAAAAAPPPASQASAVVVEARRLLAPSLRERLGRLIGPRAVPAAVNQELP